MIERFTETSVVIRHCFQCALSCVSTWYVCFGRAISYYVKIRTKKLENHPNQYCSLSQVKRSVLWLPYAHSGIYHCHLLSNTYSSTIMLVHDSWPSEPTSAPSYSVRTRKARQALSSISFMFYPSVAASMPLQKMEYNVVSVLVFFVRWNIHLHSLVKQRCNRNCTLSFWNILLISSRLCINARRLPEKWKTYRLFTGFHFLSFISNFETVSFVISLAFQSISTFVQ